MLDSTYKLRHKNKDRRRWEAAAKIEGVELAEWMRTALNEYADETILVASQNL